MPDRHSAVRNPHAALALRLVVYCASFLLLLGVGGAAPVGADPPVVVRSSEAEVNFPRDVRFQLEAESAAGISDVQLQVNTPGRRYGAAVRNVRPSFTPGPSVSASWTWPRYGNALPPGTVITYRWRITDTEGRVTETDQSAVRVQDSRYAWRELTDGAITVRWYRGDDRFGRDLLAAVRDSTERLMRLQGVDLRYPLTIHVYGSQQALYEAVPGVPRWIGGIAIPEFDTVIVGIEPNNLAWGRRALTHEMTHQLVFQMTAHPTLGSRVPTWLNEGLAVVAEGETERANRRLIDDAVANDALPTLRSLASSFGERDGHLAGLSYAAAESAVRFILDEYGAEAMRAMLRGLGDGLSPDEAAQRAYGLTLDQVEDAWRQQLGLRPFNRDRADGGRAIPTPDPDATTAARPPEDDGRTWTLGVALALIGLAVLILTAGGWLAVRRLR
jgi:hypothetical protein